jgi:menaquinone-dependent protoporphyrinogen oxidase
MGIMTDIAIIYASKFGRTRKVSKYIAAELGADSFDLKKQTVINMSEYKHIVFGTGIHAGKPFKSVVEFIETNKDELSKKRQSLFICCKFDGEKGSEQCKRVSDELKITNAAFFPGKEEKSEEGFGKTVDDFIRRLRL